MRRLVLSLFTLLALGSIAAANDYVYRDGFYWLGSSAYTRTWYQPPMYYYCGRCVYPQGYYTYTYSHSYTAPVAPVVQNITRKNWREEVLEIAAAQKKQELKLKAEQLEQEYFMQAISALGLQSQYPNLPYGTTYSGTLQYSTAGANAGTVYGYSFRDLYHNNDADLLQQQATRMTEMLGGILSQHDTQVNTLVGTKIAGQTRIAEIMAKGQAVEAFLKNLDGNKVETRTFSFKVEQAADGQLQVVPTNPNPAATTDLAQLDLAWQASAKQCLQCHSGQKLEGKFDVTRFPTMSLAQREAVFRRLIDPDDSKRMPRLANGKGGHLSADELKTWLAAAQVDSGAKQPTPPAAVPAFKK